MTNWKSLVPPVIGLLIIAFIFLSPDFHKLVADSPLIATGSIAVLSSIAGGLITIIATTIQTDAADRRSKRELAHASIERKTIRAEALIDERVSYIKSGYETLGRQFQKIRMYIRNLRSNYRTNLSVQELQTFHPDLNLESDNMYVFGPQITALKNKELTNSWNSMIVQFEALVDIYNSINVYFLQYATMAIAQRHSVFPTQDTMDKLSAIERAYEQAAAKFLANLYKRQQKG